MTQLKRYWSRVASHGCMVHGSWCAAELAHVIGKPSVTERLQECKPKGKKLPRHQWLVIPLCPQAHRFDKDSLDLNPTAFEARYGPVAGMVDQLIERLGVPVWELSQAGRK